MSSEPFFVPPNIPPKSRRGSAATLGRNNRRRSSGAISVYSQQQKVRKCIGDYIVGKTLGKGASGRVKLGVHRYTGEQVAIKIISKVHLAANPAIEKAVRREIAIMKLIHHPNVMSLIDVIDDPASSDLYLILEYVKGGELFEYLVGKGRLSESEARHHFQQIILGLDYCHHYLICHRDLKPENLLLDSKNNIKIADFGMASLQPVGSMLETSCGSPHYASPEIVTGIQYHGSSCDIWSCGVILYALLTGHLPFDDENIRLLLKKVKIGKYMMPEDISPSAQDLIRRILVVDPSKRLTMRQIMNHPWFLETEPMNLSILPVPPTAKEIGQPVADASEIDDRILETIKFLWGEEDYETVIEALIQKENNMQKVIYVLLQQHAERYWETNYGDQSDIDDSDRQPYRTIRTEKRPSPSRKSSRPVSPWTNSSDQTEIITPPASPIVEDEVVTLKKSKAFYTKFVKHVLPKRPPPQKQNRNVEEQESSPPLPSMGGTIRAGTIRAIGTLRRKNPFQRNNIPNLTNKVEPTHNMPISSKVEPSHIMPKFEPPNSMPEFEAPNSKVEHPMPKFEPPNNKVEPSRDIPKFEPTNIPPNKKDKSSTLRAKGLSLRIPGTMNTKKFGFTLGGTKKPRRQQLDFSMFQQEQSPALSMGSNYSSRPATPSLASATSTIPSPITPRTSWLDQLKQPKNMLMGSLQYTYRKVF